MANRIERKIYILKNREPRVIEYVQGASAVPIMLTLMDYDIPEDATARVYVLKPSGKGEYDTATIEDNGILIDVKSTMFDETGTNQIQASVKLGDKTLITFSQEVDVSPNKVPGEVPESENKSNFLDEYMEKLEKQENSNYETLDAKKANIADPVFTGSMSMGRTDDSAVGESSAAIGKDNIAGCKGYKIKEIYIGPESVYTDRNLAAVRFGENSPTNWKAGDLLSFDGDYHLYNRFEIIEVIDTSSYYAIGIKDNAGLEFKYRSVIDRTLTDINFVGGYFSNINCLDEGDAIPEKGCQFACGEDNKSIGRDTFTSGRNNIADGDGGAATGRDNEVGYCGFASGRGNKVNGEYATGVGHYNNVPGDIAFASGRGNEANGYCASVGGKGNKANGDYASADGAGNVADGKFAKVWGSDGNKATHAGATAWGYGNQAINDRATTWGVRNISRGNRATTWGRGNEASADNATSFGEATKATKKDATSFGRYTQSNGECALSTGAYTTANANCQFVHGRFNIPDTENKYAHIVGNGVDLKHLRNIYTLDWNGNGWFAGKVSQEGTPTEDKDLVTKKYVDDNFLTKDFAVVNSWADVQRIVRQGLGHIIFPVGYEFITHDSNSGDIVWVVRGHNYHKAADEDLKYTMTLETKKVYSKHSGAFLPLQFGSGKALYYAADGLAAGTYNFVGANQPWAMENNGVKHQFTINKAIPAGGQIALSGSGPTGFTAQTITTYPTVASSEPIESGIAITVGEEGTYIGTTDGTSENINDGYCIAFSANNYAQSPIRQWLNAVGSAGNWWSPATNFDRAPSWVSSVAAFKSGLPADFLNAVQPASIPCYTSPTFEVDSRDGTEFSPNRPYELQDDFFLLARSEILSTAGFDQLEYYKGLTTTELIKYPTTGSACPIWLRTYLPTTSNSYSTDELSSQGKYTYTPAYADITTGVCPACIIA